MDHYAWGVVELETNSSACNTNVVQMVRIHIFEDLGSNTVKKTCAMFRSRLAVVAEAEYGYFKETVISQP